MMQADPRSKNEKTKQTVIDLAYKNGAIEYLPILYNQTSKAPEKVWVKITDQQWDVWDGITEQQWEDFVGSFSTNSATVSVDMAMFDHANSLEDITLRFR